MVSVFPQAPLWETLESNTSNTSLGKISSVHVIFQQILYQCDAEKLIHAFVVSGLENCCSILAGCPNISIQMLQLIQNAAVRPLNGAAKRDFSLSGYLYLFRIQFKIMIYKARDGVAPSYLRDVIVLYQPTRPLSSPSASLLTITRVSKFRMGGKAFIFPAFFLWNHGF